MKILFLGADEGTSRHRFRALGRLGHDAFLIDPRCVLPRFRFVDQIEWKLHPALLCGSVRRGVVRSIGSERFDLALVDSGSLVGPGLVRDLKKRCDRVVNFNHDDPFGIRDGRRFASYRAAVAFYDLVVVVRKENIDEAKRHGARRILHTFRVADDIEHAPREISEEIRRKYASDVAFIGTWMPERGALLARLLELGVPLAIYGSHWQKAAEWAKIQRAWRAPNLELNDYRYAVQSARICLGLVSKGNRDQHTTRSMEIPSLGSVLCAERTEEHKKLYAEGREAVFWDSPEECAQQCKALLDDEERRCSIARRGRARFLRNGFTSERLLERIISAAFSQ